MEEFYVYKGSVGVDFTKEEFAKLARAGIYPANTIIRRAGPPEEKRTFAGPPEEKRTFVSVKASSKAEAKETVADLLGLDQRELEVVVGPRPGS
jgi:hypothetical protein